MEHSKHKGKKIQTDEGYMMMPKSHKDMPEKKHKKEMDKMMKNKKSKMMK